MQAGSQRERDERADPGTPLFTLVDLDRLYVKIYVPGEQ
jgi:multidrug resistance efflux pump